MPDLIRHPVLPLALLKTSRVSRDFRRNDESVRGPYFMDRHYLSHRVFLNFRNPQLVLIFSKQWHYLKLAHIDQALIRDLQFRDHRQGEKR
jgi:hypothetical protein